MLVDAESGDTLVRKDLTEHVGGARYFPRDPDTSPITQITMPPSWYDQNNGGTRLWGQYSRTYIDPLDEDPAPGSEAGGARVQIPESSLGGRDWLYTRTTFPAATPCPVSGCSWNSAMPASAAPTSSRRRQTSTCSSAASRVSRPSRRSGSTRRRATSRARSGAGPATTTSAGRGQRRPRAQQRELRHAVRRERPPRMQMYLFNGTQRERQRLRRRRLPRDRARALEPARRQRVREAARSIGVQEVDDG